MHASAAIEQAVRERTVGCGAGVLGVNGALLDVTVTVASGAGGS